MALDLNAAMDRLYDLSFDPYHCPELRWGASPDVSRSGRAARECQDSKSKLDWYRREYRLRNNIDRDYDAVTDLNFGPETPADVHVPRLLAEQARE